jgi:hypothetical protein
MQRRYQRRSSTDTASIAYHVAFSYSTNSNASNVAAAIGCHDQDRSAVLASDTHSFCNTIPTCMHHIIRIHNASTCTSYVSIIATATATIRTTTTTYYPAGTCSLELQATTCFVELPVVPTLYHIIRSALFNTHRQQHIIDVALHPRQSQCRSITRTVSQFNSQSDNAIHATTCRHSPTDHGRESICDASD